MNTNYIKEFNEIVQDLAVTLQGAGLVRHFDDEPPPERLGLVRPRIRHTAGKAAGPKASFTKTNTESEPDQKQPGVVNAAARPLRINEKCKDCPDRLFAARNFKRQGSGKSLVLYYNARLDSNETPFDKPGYIFSGPEDELFERMLSSVGLSMTQMHFQQLPGCFFHSAGSSPEDWNARTMNCLRHVYDTIREEDIQSVVAVGTAAVLLFGEEEAKALAESGSWTRFTYNDADLPCLVLRSPASLIALEKKRKQSTGEQKDKIKQKEVQIKKAIVDSLKKLTHV